MITIETKISDLWSEAERRAAIAELSSKLRLTMLNNSFNFGHANDCLERIGLIATKSTEFLNVNRDGILSGL